MDNLVEGKPRCIWSQLQGMNDSGVWARSIARVVIILAHAYNPSVRGTLEMLIDTEFQFAGPVQRGNG
jgi:hypothetical protein